MQARTSFRGRCSPVHLRSSDLYFPTPRVVQDKRDSKTALTFAMEKKNDAMVTALLDHNADPDIRDDVRQGAHEDERGGESMDM